MSIYYGESRCDAVIASGKKKGEKCVNGGYFQCGSGEKFSIRCGVHKYEPSQELPKNPNAQKDKELLLKKRQALCDEIAEKHKSDKKHGNIVCSKMYMMKEPEHRDGYLKIFPNYKHQNRKDGFGCASLSPKYSYDIDHRQPGLPIARNLENIHQGNKVFASEIDSEGNIKKEWYEKRLEMYKDKIPHRHKLGKTKAEHIKNGRDTNGNDTNGNVCKYSVWVDSQGNERYYSYAESRKFYCTIYAYCVYDSKDFLKVFSFVNEGYNIQICGFDARKILQKKNESVDDVIKRYYSDISQPFGHEMVLYTLLLWKLKKIKELPWIDDEIKELLPHMIIE